MKKIIYSILLSIFIFSCTTVENKQQIEFVESIVHQKSSIAINKQEIENLNLNNTVLDMKNGEINTYYVKNAKLENVLIKLDLDLNNAISDALIIENSNIKNIEVDFNLISRNYKTINKEIPFFRLKEDINLTIKNLPIYDDTQYILEKKEIDNYIYYILVPVFLTEESYIVKTNSYRVKKINLENKKYLENSIIQYVISKVTNDRLKYNENYYILDEVKPIKGKGKFEHRIVARLENGEVYQSYVDKENNFCIYIPKEYKGKVILYQLDEKTNIKSKDVQIEVI